MEETEVEKKERYYFSKHERDLLREMFLAETTRMSQELIDDACRTSKDFAAPYERIIRDKQTRFKANNTITKCIRAKRKN